MRTGGGAPASVDLATTPDPAFVRAAPTRLGYGAIASYAYWLYAFGPALSLLRTELHLSYTLIGVFSAVWSGGAALSGAVFAAIVRRAGRSATLWASAAVASVGAALFGVTHTVAVCLVGAGVLGFAGTTLLSVAQSVLADEHGDRRDRALVEANVAAAGCAVVAPPLLGALAVTPVGWRWNFALPALALVALALAYRRVPLPAGLPTAHAGGRGRLSLRCTVAVVLVALGIAVEFCLIYFGAEQVQSTGLSAASATSALGAFYVGILLGRVLGAALTARPGRTVVLLWVSLAFTAAGFVVFWLAGQPAPAIAGLLVAGLGVANLYPLSLALALALAGGRTDAANALTQLIGGIAVVVAPFVLGALADHSGLHAAFGVELVLIGASALLLFAAAHGRSRVTPGRAAGRRCPS